jgi:hypothetical protein
MLTDYDTATQNVIRAEFPNVTDEVIDDYLVHIKTVWDEVHAEYEKYLADYVEHYPAEYNPVKHADINPRYKQEWNTLRMELINACECYRKIMMGIDSSCNIVCPNSKRAFLDMYKVHVKHRLFYLKKLESTTDFHECKIS